MPVLGLELAARQYPAPYPGPSPRRSHPGPYPPGRQGPRPGSSTPAGPAVVGRRRALMHAVCCLSLFMVGLDNTIVNVGLPAIGEDLHAGVSGLQWTVAAYTIVLAALLMFSGALADRIGRRTAMFDTGEPKPLRTATAADR